MPIDPLREEVFSLAGAARRLPRVRGNRPVSPATVWRWAAHGLRGIKLDTVKLGGVTCTSADALRRFFARLSGETAPSAPLASAPGPDAAKQLDEIGI
jgi:hypothetical protein